MESFKSCIAKSRAEYRNDKTKIGYVNSAGNIYLLCPFHVEKTPSMVIHTKTKEYFICYGCGKCGRVKKMEKNLNFRFPERKRRERNTDQLEFKFVLDFDELPF